MKIIFLAFTSKKYDGHGIKIDRPDLTRKMSCLETWVPKIEDFGHEVIFFDGSNDVQSFDDYNKTLHCICNESYDYAHNENLDIPSFMFERLKEAIQWCLKNRDFDYIFRTDDGSYINSYVIDEMVKDVDGFDFVYSDMGGGGSGMFISKKACEKLVVAVNEKRISIEDKALLYFFNQNEDLTKKPSKLLCHQYILSEDFFTIHYTNGKRQYFVDDVITYYFNELPIDRKVILNYDLDASKSLKVKTWDGDFGGTPIYYSLDKDSYNWEHYGKVARNYYPVTATCPFAKNSIKELVFYNVIFDLNNFEQQKLLSKYIQSVKDNGFIYFFFENENYHYDRLLNYLCLVEKHENFILKNDYIKNKKGLFLKMTKL